MIVSPSCSEIKRDKVISYIKRQGYKRVVDVGGALGPWAREVVTHYIDLQTKEDARKNDPNTCDSYVENARFIQADINNSLSWGDVKNEILQNGLFDFAICTQTLEHVQNPEAAVKLLQLVASHGFVSVPNKYTELRRGVSFSDEGLKRCGVKGHWRGFAPHRWILTIRDDTLWFWPKLNILEYLDGIDEWVDPVKNDIELSFFWNREIPIKIISDVDIDHPDPQIACELYRKELKIGI